MTERTLARWSFIVFALIAVVAIVLWVLNTLARDRHDSTWREMGYFRTALQDYSAMKGTAPTSLRDALCQLQGDAKYRQWLQAHCSLIASGNDAWGNEFVYELDRAQGIVTLRSKGPNGIDEPGGGDDIHLSITVWVSRGASKPGTNGK